MRFVLMFSACSYMKVGRESTACLDFSTGPRKAVDKDRKFFSPFLFLLSNLISFEVISRQQKPSWVYMWLAETGQNRAQLISAAPTPTGLRARPYRFPETLPRGNPQQPPPHRAQNPGIGGCGLRIPYKYCHLLCAPLGAYPLGLLILNR